MLSPTHSLKPFNTLGLEISADEIVLAASAEELLQAWQQSQAAGKPFLLLGGGSNVLFLNDFKGIVAVNQIKGITVSGDESGYDLHVGAGENWHELVQYCLQHDIPGLENLALIPGVAGSAPIQNIGAYGIEFKDVCHYVDVLNLNTGETFRLNSLECQFGYRDSIFKHQYRKGYAVVAVGLRLSRQWQPVLTYGDLVRLDAKNVTPYEVFNAVCSMRKSKLPDPAIQGNVGSFFKNPLITAEQGQRLLDIYPSLLHYPQPDGLIKLAAGWLIDQCQLKGYQLGGAAVHRMQALVLINQRHAQPQDIVKLAGYVRQMVGKKFDVWLEPEVRFIDALGECDAVGSNIMKDYTVPLKVAGILADGEFHSGEQLGEACGMSRAAINQHINTLKSWGLDIYTVTGKGYCLSAPLQLLDAEIIRQNVTGSGEVSILPVIDSTNQFLMNRMTTLFPGDTCIAEYQQSGRGRRGRQWFSPFGANLYMSMYWRLEQGPAAAMGLSLVVGIVMAEVLQSLGAKEVRVKWPNDLYLNDKKLAGILVELSGKTGDVGHIVIGAGINLMMRQVDNSVVGQQWISLQEAGIDIDRNTLAVELINTLRSALQLFETEGLAPFINRWESLDNYINRPVKLIIGEREVHGIARGIDSRGGLLLEQDGQVKPWVGGEISLRGQ